MDKDLVGSVVNSISRLIHLVACQTLKNSDSKAIKYIVRDLKLLKPVLDEALDAEINLDKELTRALEGLDIIINQSREFVEKRSDKRSKFCSILQIEPMALKIRDFSMHICHLSMKYAQPISIASQSAIFQHCVQELECGEEYLTSELINSTLKDQRENSMPSLNGITRIMEKLDLTSAHELLVENVALEKKRMKAEIEKNAIELNNLNEIIGLLAHIRHYMANFEKSGFINGVAIPSYFRCPLSLELMLDPVIAASGQTYERSFIEKWLDSGLKICPKTNQTLAHTNLTPNFTVKGLIANWCEDNNIALCDYAHPDSISLKDLSRFNSFNGSLCRESSSGSKISIVMEKLTSQSNISCDQHSCTHSRSISLSSVISSIDMSSKYDEKACLLEATFPSSSTSDKNATNFHNDDLTDRSHVYKLIEDIKSNSVDLQTTAASELRRLTKHNKGNRILIARCGAIIPLLSLLTSNNKKIQENAVTAILNLSINDSNRISIAEAGAIEPLINVLNFGNTEAQENSAATLYSLSSLEEYKAQIGRSGAVKALVNLLASGSIRGKKDAATALFSLSIFHENKARIVRAGAVRYIIQLMDPDSGMVDKCVALLANICTINEGRVTVAQEGGIPLLVEIIENGSERGKENAASALFQMCINNPKYCSLVLQEGAVPPLVALSQFGTPRAKEKAQQILGHFRSQREGTIRKQKS